MYIWIQYIKTFGKVLSSFIVRISFRIGLCFIVHLIAFKNHNKFLNNKKYPTRV